MKNVVEVGYCCVYTVFGVVMVNHKRLYLIFGLLLLASCLCKLRVINFFYPTINLWGFLKFYYYYYYYFKDS